MAWPQVAGLFISLTLAVIVFLVVYFAININPDNIPTTQPGLNKPCLTGLIECGPGLACNGTVCKATDEQPCTQNTDCFVPGSVCVGGKICRTGVIQDGGLLNAPDPSFGCLTLPDRRNLVPDRFGLLCVLQDGEGCSSSNQCFSDLCSGGICAVSPKGGEVCNGFCQDQFVCDTTIVDQKGEGICQTPGIPTGSPGAFCTSDFGCDVGSCIQIGGGIGMCSNGSRGLGDICGPLDCIQGAVCSNTNICTIPIGGCNKDNDCFIGQECVSTLCTPIISQPCSTVCSTGVCSPGGYSIFKYNPDGKWDLIATTRITGPITTFSGSVSRFGIFIDPTLYIVSNGSTGTNVSPQPDPGIQPFFGAVNTSSTFFLGPNGFYNRGTASQVISDGETLSFNQGSKMTNFNDRITVYKFEPPDQFLIYTQRFNNNNFDPVKGNAGTAFSGTPLAVFQSGSEILALSVSEGSNFTLNQFSCSQDISSTTCSQTTFQLGMNQPDDVSINTFRSEIQIVYLSGGSVFVSRGLSNFIQLPGNFAPGSKCLLINGDIYVVTSNICS